MALHPTRPFLFVAEHLGPRQTLGALASCAPDRTEVIFLHASTPQTPEEHLRALKPLALVRGTSDISPRENLEHRYAKAAIKLKIPVFVIEDFPLNYQGDLAKEISGLFIEFQESATVLMKKGVPRSKIFVTGNPRYGRVVLGRPKITARNGKREKKHVFWAGQPDSYSCYNSLQMLLPTLKKYRVHLYFRAHPRDEKYRLGHYSTLLSQSGVKFSDITLQKRVLPYITQSDLVLTEFSSVGVEALYRGIPVVFVLFPRWGAERLKRLKGSAMLPWVAHQCAMAVTSSRHIEPILSRALLHPTAGRTPGGTLLSLKRLNRQSGPRIWDTILKLSAKKEKKMREWAS